MAQKPSSSKTPVTPTEGAAASAPSPATDTNRLQAVLARTSVESADVNAIRAVRRRAAAKTDPASSAVAAKPSAAKSSPTNEPTPRVATALPAPVASAASDAAVDETTVPDAIRQQFVQVGRKYYFPDGVRAFTDRGQRLTTPSENTAVIRSLVTIAQARGWDKIAVRGTSRFRREAWLAARLQGIEVRGYRPNGFEAAKLVRTLAERNAPASAPATASTSASDPTMRVTRAEGTAAERPAAPPRAMLAGELMDHGRATYQHDPHEPMSYFVKLLTARGERTIWGVDLERAFKESVTQPKTRCDRTQ
jgi:putative DNA primase/helicase